MRHLFLTIFFVIVFLFGKAQTASIDSLIVKIDNEKLVGVCNYIWVLKNSSKQADSLIRIGVNSDSSRTEITKKLYGLLTDTTKGIIAHYILCNIWYSDRINSSSFYYYDKDSTLEYEYEYLKFFENKYKRMFAENSELVWNKRKWAVLLRQLNIID